MSKPKAKRHKWEYPVGWWSTDERHPAKCSCGSRMFAQRRKSKAGGMFAGSSVTDTIFLEPDGTRHVNPSPVPPCSRP